MEVVVATELKAAFPHEKQRIKELESESTRQFYTDLKAECEMKKTACTEELQSLRNKHETSARDSSAWRRATAEERLRVEHPGEFAYLTQLRDLYAQHQAISRQRELDRTVRHEHRRDLGRDRNSGPSGGLGL